MKMTQKIFELRLMAEEMATLINKGIIDVYEDDNIKIRIEGNQTLTDKKLPEFKGKFKEEGEYKKCNQ